MGNFGWIREDSLDAFLEGTSRTPDPGPALPKLPLCPFCELICQSSRKLQDHVLEKHSVEPPRLWIKKAEPAKQLTIRKAVKEVDFTFINVTTTEICADGGRIMKLSPDTAIKKLASYRNTDVLLKLSNNKGNQLTPVETTYNLSFRINDTSDLREIELAFNEILVKQHLTIDSIRKFIQDKRAQGPAKDYADALASFCIGILQREQPKNIQLTTRYAQYRENFGSSLDVLADIERPLAELICAIIRFAFNEPVSYVQQSGFWELDLANTLINEPEREPLPLNHDQTREKKPVCPIDHGTERILNFAVQMAFQTRWSKVLQDECRATAASEALDLMDRQKALAIWARITWRLGAYTEAEEPLRHISATYPFSKWAGPYLEKVAK